MPALVSLPSLRAHLASRSGFVAAEGAGRRAAVALVLLPRHETLDILLIRRAERAGDLWSGHMALPGGRQEPGDATLADTAIRETLEEVGLDLRAEGELLGRLDDLPATGRGKAVGMVVSPWVFAVEREPRLTPNDEVDEAIWAPLAAMIDGSTDTTMDYRYEGDDLTLPGYLVGERVVWGMTHRMLGFLFDAIRAST
ncbi:MAG: CoA pyrophosphatase [Polyangiaceae bacterium]